MQYPHKERTMTRDGCKQPRDTKWPQNSHKDKQKFHKVKLFCVSFSPGVYRMSRGLCTCLRIRKNRFTFIISGLIVCGWNNMTSYLFTCCPPAFCRLAWPNLWRLRGSAECIVQPRRPLRPLTFALIAYLALILSSGRSPGIRPQTDWQHNMFSELLRGRDVLSEPRGELSQFLWTSIRLRQLTPDPASLRC